MYNQDLIDAVLASADIVTVISSYLEVHKRGRNHLAVCPFHDDKNPSMNISKEKQIFKCFACGAGGNAITFVQKYERCSFMEAVRKVAEISGFQDPRLKAEAPKIPVDENIAKLYACINDLHTFYKYALTTPEGEQARAYCASRGLDEETIKKYGIGYAPLNGAMTIQYLTAKGHSLKSIEDIGIALAQTEGMRDNNAGRLIFPLSNRNGQVIGFSARRLDGAHENKYINTPETPIFQKGKNLYNYHNAAQTARHDGYCYVLEGFMDVIALNKAGINSAVALMGTALTAEQVRLLKDLRAEIRICLDGDTAGQMGMTRMISGLSQAKVDLRVVDYGNDSRDPDDIFQEGGKEALTEKMSHLIDPLDFQLNYYVNVKHLDSREDREKILNTFLPFVRAQEPGFTQEDYLDKLAKATNIGVEAIRRRMLLVPKGEETEIEAVYHDAAQTMLSEAYAERGLLVKLATAERTLLYYMLSEPGAVNYFKANLGDFYTQPYEDIAMYIIDYNDSNQGGKIEVGRIISAIQAADSDNSEDLQEVVSRLSLAKTFGEYSEEILQRCVNIINEEKDVNNAHEQIQKAIDESPKEEDTLKAITDFAAKKRALWQKRAKKAKE